MVSQGIIERYRAHLNIGTDTPIISLCEGSTPLIAAPRLAKAIHRKLDVWLKFEGLNPTGSFKDRGMTMAVTKAVEAGYRTVMCASTGNTSASASAYAARAGIKCVVLIPEGNIAQGKLAQAMIHGATVIQIKANFDKALELVREIAEDNDIALVNSINPHRLEGQKTGAFEIVDAFDGVAPDFHVLPVGNAGNISAYWKGYMEYHTQGKSANLPSMIGFQAAGSAPIVVGHAIEDPQTFATAIRIGNPASWELALKARDESRGAIGMVTDHQIRIAYKALATSEGIFAEPASAAGIAGLFKLAESGFFDNLKPYQGDRLQVVCVLTGHGLKDPTSALKFSQKAITVEATADAVLASVDFEEPSTV